ncbi:MAG TPA: putative glycolipid-binding domain-containing protein [Actinomycetota bacterium]
MSDAGASRTRLRSVHWRRLDTPGSEHFSLWQTESGWDLTGTVVVTLDDAPVRAEYAVRCGTDWTTEQVDVRTSSASVERSLRLRARGRRWWLNDNEVDALSGSIDVDLGVTPSTNTLPIRRLALKVGDQADLQVSWVRFPDLDVTLSDQRYTRLSENTYRYESGSFSRDIEVDELGLVTSYPGLFVCESAAGP